MEKKIPDFFSDKKQILNYDFNLEKYINSDNDNSFIIDNLSIYDKNEKKKICENFFKSILLGYNHIFITKILEKIGFNKNISLPLFNSWNKTNNIDNLVIINNEIDAERIAKKHIKKTPIFKSLLDTSIISTTDNKDWKQQRNEMNMGFLPNILKDIFDISRERAEVCNEILKIQSNNFTDSVNMSDFFLNETQAQLQLAMFGFNSEFESKTNKKIRNVFAGINTEYLKQFSKEALDETLKSNGPISKLFHNSKDLKKNIGNIILFAFAGHDTTGHTLTWLLYELCKNLKYKKDLIDEVDLYWKNNKIPTYDTLNQLPFMTKCITETLRLWPALANGTYRELERDDYIKGHNGKKVYLKKGTYCQIINWTRHRNPELWGKDVNEFNPYRNFKTSEIWNNKGFSAYNTVSERYSPFTYSPRNCLGKNFSHMEMRLILLNIFKNFDFQLDEYQKKTVNNPKYLGLNTFTLGPKSIKQDELLGMYLKINLRNSKL